MFKKIVVASNNINKIQEFNQLFKLWDVKIVHHGYKNIFHCEETGTSFIENALLKAKYYAQYTSLPVLSDDSGICVRALSGKPGIYSSIYSGINICNQQNNIKTLLNNMIDINSMEDRSAYFYCALVFLRNIEDQEPVISIGKLNGYIAYTPQGINGFGYDSIFYVKQHNCTLAQLDKKNKNIISHRAKAVINLQKILLTFY